MTDNLPPLLPCPFCGGTPKTIERPDNIDGTEFVYAVSCCCDGYSARAHQLARCKTPEQAKAAATSAWNRRAALAQAQICVPAELRLEAAQLSNILSGMVEGGYSDLETLYTDDQADGDAFVKRAAEVLALLAAAPQPKD